MEGMLLPIIAAAAAMLLFFSGWQIVLAITNSEKRRLKQRLTSEGREQAISAAQKAVLLTQEEKTALASVLTRWSFFENLNRTLTHAYPDATLGKFLSIAGAIGAGVFLVMLAITQQPLVSGVAGVIGIYMPCVWLGSRKAKRQRMLSDQLPEALDFLSRILKAGHSLSTGLQMMGEELPQPLAAEFRKAYDQHSLGSAMDACLKDMARRIESTDFAFFVTAVLIQRQTGGDLSEVLGNISGMIRQRIRLQQHVKAKTAEGRFTGYLLSAFPAVLFCVSYALNPEFAGTLINTSTGLTLLGIAFGLQIMGLFCIKKITTVTV
jgi:tight adherence protein B